MISNSSNNKDVVDFLYKNPFRGFVFTLSQNDRYPKFLVNRILTLYGFINGYFSVIEFIKLILPNNFKSDNLKVRYFEFVTREGAVSAKSHIEKFINADGSVIIYGHRFYPVNDNYCELIEFISQIFINDQYKVCEYLTDGSVVIDAGANIGSFSAYISNAKKNLKIYAFEPVKRTFEILLKNTSSYATVYCYNLGLGDKVDRKKIFSNNYSSGGSAFEDRGITESHDQVDFFEEAGITTIDEFVRQNNLPKVDFIKIDTEGYEEKILRGASETIRRFRPIMVMSAYHKADDKVVLPQLVRSICPDYEYILVCAHEEDFIFYPKK
ncbi:MAG: FkbM family methyltransferase [Candidatus Taylorbacteria bacterium]